MTPKAADALARASRLLTYPEAGCAADLDALICSLADWEPRAAHDVGDFAVRIIGLGVPALQELFTRTFDLNPVCALEVGWHLFGEEYERGAFLVRMRQALREHGISEGGELPDHLAAMLLLVTKLDAEEADKLIANGLVPAVDKMLDPLEKSESPFFPLVKAIRQVLVTCGPSGTRAERRGASGPPQATRLAGCRGLRKASATLDEARRAKSGGPRHSNEAIHG